MTQTSITSTTFKSANTKATGAVSFEEATFKKSGTITVNYGSTGMTFSTVTDYLIFVNEVVIPMTNKVLSASSAGAGYVAIVPGTPSTFDAIVD